MLLTILILSFFVFIKTIGYAIYEYKERSNTISAIIILILAFIALILPCIVTIIK